LRHARVGEFEAPFSPLGGACYCPRARERAQWTKACSSRSLTDAYMRPYAQTLPSCKFSRSHRKNHHMPCELGTRSSNRRVL